MKRGIAALMIAAAMIMIPGTLNAAVYFQGTQYLAVASNGQEVNSLPVGWSYISYRYETMVVGTHVNTPYRQNNYYITYTTTNHAFHAWLYSYSVGRYVDEFGSLNHYTG